MRIARPGGGVRAVVRPQDSAEIELIGGELWGDVSMTRAQDRALLALYGDRGHAHPVHHALDKSAAVAQAQRDGLRMVALLAGFLRPGEDPAEALHGLMIDAGFPVPAWEGDE